MFYQAVLAVSSRRFHELYAFFKILQCNTSLNKDDGQAVSKSSFKIKVNSDWFIITSASANDEFMVTKAITRN